MNKVLIRNRQIDNNRQLQILLRENDELSDFHEYSNTNRGSQILSGMDKGEETEHHFQEALRELDNAKTIVKRAIPIPGVSTNFKYDDIYDDGFQLPNSYIRVKILDLEVEQPEYDMDDKDEEWLCQSRLDITKNQFEFWIEQFERASSQKILLLDEAKTLLRNDPTMAVIKVYDYWLQKRQEAGQSLILSVKCERAERPSNAPVDPYVAFRKRSEKMTTRKNRRVDESSYEKMYRLKQEMTRLNHIIQLVCNREQVKYEKIKVDKSLFVKRFESKDFDRSQLKELESLVKKNNLKSLPDIMKLSGLSQRASNREFDTNQKENKRKRLNNKSVESAHAQSSIDNEDYTFRPMAKCKYLRSRFTNCNRTFSEENKSDKNTPSRSDTKKYSYSNLMFLPEKLRNSILNPIRFRMNRSGTLSIDLESSCNPNSCSISTHNQHQHDHETRCRLVPDSAPCHNALMNSLVNCSYNPPSMKQDLMKRILVLCQANVYCGLKPLSCSLTNNNSQTTCCHPESNSTVTMSCLNSSSETASSSHSSAANKPTTIPSFSTNNTAPSITNHNTTTNGTTTTSTTTTTTSTQISHKISTNKLRTSKSQNLSSQSINHNNAYQSNKTNNNNLHHNKLSNHLSNHNSKNGHFQSMMSKEVGSEKCRVNGDSRERHHHSIEEDGPEDEEQVPLISKIKDISCLKSLNNNSHLLTPNTNCTPFSSSSSSSSPDADSLVSTETSSTAPIVSDYSLMNLKTSSNGHQKLPSSHLYSNHYQTHNTHFTNHEHTNYSTTNNNHRTQQHHHNNNNNHHHHHSHHHHQRQKKWLGANSQNDSLFKGSELMTLWKTDQHIVSGINKIT